MIFYSVCACEQAYVPCVRKMVSAGPGIRGSVFTSTSTPNNNDNEGDNVMVVIMIVV